MDELYIPRQLKVGDRTYSEQELLQAGTLFLVLAEPGAGKTDLLNQLSSLTNTKAIRASLFKSTSTIPAGDALVIDALDEVARIDRLAMDDIIVKASELASGRPVILSGRSSEWDQANTEHAKDCFGVDPIVVRLEPFDEAEQRQLFGVHHPGEDFDTFLAEADKLELVPLFGNPQFLRLFGDAYVQSGRHFTSKAAIFSDAVKRLAHESNKRISQRDRPTVEQLVELAGTLFSKLLLSGASGVNTVEQLKGRDYPFLSSLAGGDAHHLTDTRLMKPAGDVGKHEPVHRIVAEYCAARYLAKRVDDPRDRLSLKRVLAVVAPSGVVRTELRGLLGWMAALSQETTQLALAALDPYAVFANGDPSQLTGRAKKAVLKHLNEAAQKDPYFRRDDVWRRFNVGGFFTSDIRDDVSAILSLSAASSSLRQLVVELLPSSGGASQFVPELRALALGLKTPGEIRKAAHSALLDIPAYDPVFDLATLIAESTATSLEVAATTVRKVGVPRVADAVVTDLLRQLAALYPRGANARDALSGSRYFIRRTVDTLPLPTVIAVLDGLTHNLICTCAPKHDALCECRVGTSKIAGFVLDRHFALGAAVPSARDLWKWLKNLRYRNFRSGRSSAAVSALSDDETLRREIQWLALTESADEAKVRAAMIYLFSSSTHSGIVFHAGDMEALAQRAYDENNVPVWGALWRGHNRHDTRSGSNPVRTRQRAHANVHADFLREWWRNEKRRRDIDLKDRFRYRFRRRKRERQEALVEERNRIDFETNRVQIEAGTHWGWLKHFTHLYLLEPEKLTSNPNLGETSLLAIRNCIPFLTPHIPSLRDLSEQKGSAIAEVFLAHCIVRFRDGTPLDELPQTILRAAVTEFGGYPTFNDDAERMALGAEFGRLVFDQPNAPEEFARELIEPPLASDSDTVSKVHWLNDKPAFHHLRASLPLDWLEKYPQMPMQPTRELFDIAAEHGDRARLAALIDRRFADPYIDSGEDTNEDKIARGRHHFWALNSFFYTTGKFDEAWAELRQDRNNLLAIDGRVGHFGIGREVSPLSADTIYLLLDGFVAEWPKVPLPSSYGTGSPDSERAYRFLDAVVWRIGNDIPSRKLPVIDRMLSDARFVDFNSKLLTLKAEAQREFALQDYSAPVPEDVAALLDSNEVASVEDLRALIVEELEGLQVWLKGVETDPLVTFYDAGEHVDENTGRNRVVDQLNSRMKAMGLSVVIEHHMAAGNRCDFTASATMPSARALLVVEVKGQWNKELYTAAAEQLDKRYAIHPDAAGQGVYLVFWYGDAGDSIAGKADPAITSAADLKKAILASMPEELKAVIDVVVLDVSHPSAGKAKSKKPKSPATKTRKVAAAVTTKPTRPKAKAESVDAK